MELPIERFPRTRLTGRIEEPRHNVTSYDAACLAPTEVLGVQLRTPDRRLADAPGIRCGTVVPESA